MIDTIAEYIFSQFSASGFNTAGVSFIVLTTYSISKLHKTSNVIKFFSNKKTIGQFCIIFLWCFLVYRFVKKNKNENKNSHIVENVKSATKKAVVALLIAFFARIDLVFAPFWLVWIIAYYLEDWI